MTANSALSRNLFLLMLLIAGGIVLLCLFVNVPLELPLVGLAGFGLLLYVGAKFPECFLVAALFAPQWKTFWVLQRVDKAIDLTLAMLLCLAVALIWRVMFQMGRSSSWSFRALFFGQGNQILAFLLFAAIVAVSYAYTNAPDYGGSKMSRVVTIGLLMFLAPFFLILSEEHLRRLARIFVGFSMATAVQLVYTLERGTQDPNADITRIGAGWLLGMAAILVLFYPLVPSRRAQKALFLFVLPICVAGLVASAARGPIVALAAAVLTGSSIWLRQGRLRGRTAFVLLLLLSAGFGGAYLFFRQANLDKYTGKTNELVTLVSGGSASGSAGQRLDYYRATLAAIPNHLFLGNGVGSWSMFYYGNDLRNYPHNILLEIGFEEGLIGVAAFLIFLAAVSASIMRMLRTSRWHFLALGLLVLYCGLVSLFSGDLDDNRVMFFWAGVALAVCRTVRLRSICGQFARRSYRAYRGMSVPQTPPAWSPAFPAGIALRRRSTPGRGRTWREKYVY